MKIQDETLFSSDDDEPDLPRTQNPRNNIKNLSNLNKSILETISTKLFQRGHYTQNNSSECSDHSICSCFDHSSFIQRIFHFTMRTIVRILRLVQQIIVFIYFAFILIAILPFVILKNVLLFLKCYTGSKHIYYIPFKIIPTILIHVCTSLQGFFAERSKNGIQKYNFGCVNSNNNLEISNGSSKQKSNISKKVNTRKILLLSLGCVVITLLIYFNIDDISDAISANNFQKIVLYPGEKCMKAGKCCKGILETIFRWLTCFISIPFRELLFLWPISKIQEKNQYDGLNEGLDNYIEKVKDEFNQLKEKIKHEDELIMTYQKKFIDLEQNVQENENIFNKLKPVAVASKKNVQKLKDDIERSMVTLQKVIYLRRDVYKLIESIKLYSDDEFNSAKETFIHFQESLDLELGRLHSNIVNLESDLLKKNLKINDKNYKLLQIVSTEINQIKNLQLDFKKRILPLIKLPLTYKEISHNLQKDLNIKINEEYVHHEQMNKFTEKSCSAYIDKLDKDLKKIKLDLSCFTNQAVRTEGQSLENKMRKDISSRLIEKTLEMVKVMTEKAIFRHESNIIKQKVKKCSLFDHVFNMHTGNNQCLMNFKSNLLTSNDVNKMAEKHIVKDKIDILIAKHLRIYTADDIGIVDYASESSGGSVISDWSSHTYSGRAAFLSIFGLTFGKVVKSLRKIIQPGGLPGECWAFKYDKGHVVIRLAKPIAITSITIDHVSSQLTPDGKILSAPKHFILYGLSNYDDYTGIKLGEFEYSKTGEPIQTFNLLESSPVTQYVQVKFLSNHGNKEYTCIYRIRIHGDYYKIK